MHDLSLGKWEANEELYAMVWHELTRKNITPINNLKDRKERGDKGGKNN